MCGIVGIIGTEPVAPRLVDALKRLEYRGYDSAGVATLEHGSIARRRAEGKLGNLATKLGMEPLEGRIGIGHTRWATHGAPTEGNAHPHATDKVAVVHNGIIENFRELLADLGRAVDEIEQAAARLAVLSTEVGSPRALATDDPAVVDLARRVDWLAQAHAELVALDRDAGLASSAIPATATPAPPPPPPPTSATWPPQQASR